MQNTDEITLLYLIINVIKTCLPYWECQCHVN